jgi:hypothetical protein
VQSKQSFDLNSDQLLTPKKLKKPGGPSTPDPSKTVLKKMFAIILIKGIKLKIPKTAIKAQNLFGKLFKLHVNNKPKTIGNKA